MKYINLFDTQAAYDAAEKYYPNVSYIEATDEVVYQEISPEPHSDIIVAKFTTTSANQNVKITNKQQYFSSIAADGEPLTIGTGALNHTFASAGEHEIEYKALDTTLIPNNAFQGCSGLTSITIPDSVTTIGGSAFQNCTGLTSVTIPNSVTTIVVNAFNGCTSLTSVTIPNSVTTIGINAFSECAGLTSVTIPNSVTSIGEGAFYGCRGLTSVTIGNSVTSIGDSAFGECAGLTSITVGSGNRVYNDGNGSNCIIQTATNTLVFGCNNTVIPNSVTSIGMYAFGGCTSLTSVTIPNSVTSIGEGAFYGCRGLTSVTIGNSVTSIGDSAFGECAGLTSITSLATTPPTIQHGTFDNIPYDCPIYVPSSSVNAYKAAQYWSAMAAYIQPIQ